MLSLRDLSSQLFSTGQEQQKEVCGDICLSKQSHCVASSDLLMLVRVEHLGCGQCFTSLPAAHKFPPKTLSIY